MDSPGRTPVPKTRFLCQHFSKKAPIFGRNRVFLAVLSCFAYRPLCRSNLRSSGLNLLSYPLTELDLGSNFIRESRF
jgi:hypothetical protein